MLATHIVNKPRIAALSNQQALVLQNLLLGQVDKSFNSVAYTAAFWRVDIQI